MISLRTAKIEDLESIRKIGTITYWHAYRDILEEEQLKYMLEKFYAVEALRIQLMEGHIFLIAQDEEQDVGFASYSLFDGDPMKVKLHKLYVLPDAHGRGIGKFLLNEVRDKALRLGAKGLRLNVNRYNKARYFYESAGFVIKETVDIAIGNGFFMNDFVMELSL